jgi:hypothetical protein
MITNDDDGDRPTGMEGSGGVPLKLIPPDLHRETEENHEASISTAGFQTARIQSRDSILHVQHVASWVGKLTEEMFCVFNEISGLAMLLPISCSRRFSDDDLTVWFTV